MYACVNNGDNAIPGAIMDDRNTKMLPLTGTNLKPLVVPGGVTF